MPPKAEAPRIQTPQPCTPQPWASPLAFAYSESESESSSGIRISHSKKSLQGRCLPAKERQDQGSTQKLPPETHLSQRGRRIRSESIRPDEQNHKRVPGSRVLPGGGASGADTLPSSPRSRPRHREGSNLSSRSALPPPLPSPAP